MYVLNLWHIYMYKSHTFIMNYKADKKEVKVMFLCFS